MSEVALQIGGRPYKVACADGEEPRLRKLAGMIDGKLAALGSTAGVGEAQSLLFAALFLADELDEARRASPPAAVEAPQGVSADYLETIADRLESLADRLENPAPAP